jgi:predicted transcriptional regulator
MGIQMTVRIGDDEARFVDEAARAGEGSRAEIINRALAREMRRRAAARDAQIYTASRDEELESDAYAEWAAHNAAAVTGEID